VVGALSVSGPATRLTRSRIPAVATRCMAEASALSALLGYRPGRSRRQPQKEGAA
jgi:DNA-binding IclR family transcriptional regulator